MESITVNAVKEFAKKYKQSMMVVMGWNRPNDITMVTTWGETIDECAKAAESGNNLKQALGWPDELCNSIPPRMTKEQCDKILKREAIIADTTKHSGIVVSCESKNPEIILTYDTLRALMFKLRLSINENNKTNKS